MGTQRTRETTGVVLSDVHIPFHDVEATSAVHQFLADIQPDDIILNGDIVDFYAISRYIKKRTIKRSIQNEINLTKEFLGTIRNSNPDANIWYLMGNHEQRLEDYLDNHAELDLESLEFDSLFNLKALNVVKVPSPILNYNGITITHGNAVLAKAGFTAHKMIDTYGVSGISGHTHRKAHVTRRKLDTQVEWVESGCLCQLDPHYGEGFADWRHGFVVTHSLPGRVYPEPISVDNGVIYHDGVVYSGQKESEGN